MRVNKPGEEGMQVEKREGVRGEHSPEPCGMLTFQGWKNKKNPKKKLKKYRTRMRLKECPS